MTDVVQPTQPEKRRLLRMILLFSALLTTPMFCCGTLQVVDALPPSLLPASLDFIVNLFEASAQVNNRTGETLYITAVTTTYGQPMVISQNVAFRQRDIPLQPNTSVVLEYDSVDFPLAGIAVCRTDDECKVLAVDYSGVYHVDSYEALPDLDPSWRAAIQSHPLHNYSSVLILALSLLPVLFVSALWYVGHLEKQAAG